MTLLDVVSAGFAPVKGTAHRPYADVELTGAGAVGDRGLCLVDPVARRVLRTVQNPALLTVVARREGDLLTVEVPGAAPVTGRLIPSGERLTCEYWGRPVDLELLDGPHAAAFGTHLGTDVRLAAAPPAGVVFAGPGVTLLGTASLRDLGARVGRDLVAEAARFRATLVVETGTPYEEEGWLGRELRAGSAVLRAGVGIPRCAVVDHSPATAAKDAPVLRTLAAYRPRNRAGEPVLGIYADVVTPGRISSGRVSPG